MSTRKCLAASFAVLVLGIAGVASAQIAPGHGGVVTPSPKPSVQAKRNNDASVSLTVDDLKTGGWDCTLLEGGYYCTKDGQTPKSCTADGKSCALQAKKPVSPAYKGPKLKATH